MKFVYTLFFLASITLASAQETIGFESLALPLDSFDREGLGQGGRAIEGLNLGSTFQSFGEGVFAWTGTTIATGTDVTTPGFMNQFSSITGGGHDGSTHYGIGYTLGTGGLGLQDPEGQRLTALQITNTTYAALSMRDGDGVAKRFGGITGDDPDFFLLTIHGYLDGQEVDNTIEFYLADYRFADNSMDYIVQQWERVELSDLGLVDSLSFVLTSSDVGMFGMNTPAYFAFDNVEVTMLSNTSEVDQLAKVHVYPNPATDRLTVQSAGSIGDIRIYDAAGMMVLQTEVHSTQATIEVSGLTSGIYILMMVLPSGDVTAQKVVID